jgi:endonuclease/exonuclease/phosphatase (EEP) superfamily protein YafD
MSPVWTIDILGERVSLGNAILSRFPLEKQTTEFVHGELYHKASSQDTIPNARNLQTVEVVVGNERLSLANHHAFWDISPLGSDTSVEKMQHVKSTLEKLPRPLIFSGDMNVKSESPVMRVFDGFLEDLTATHNVTSTLSVHGKVADVACDHILISDTVKVSSFRVADDLISDHKALILEFEL